MAPLLLPRAGAAYDPEPSPSRARARADGEEPPRADLPARARGHGQAAGPVRARRRQTGTRVRLLFPVAPQGWPCRRLASWLVGNGRRLL